MFNVVCASCVPVSIRNVCAHYAHMHIIRCFIISAVFFYFFLRELFASVRNVQLCDVTCLFLLSEKRQGSIDSPSKSET